MPVPQDQFVESKAPPTSHDFSTPAEVARFKRAQRECDRVLLSLGIESPESLQRRNAIAATRDAIRLLDFETAQITSTRKSGQ